MSTAHGADLARTRVTALLEELGVEQPVAAVTDLSAHLGVVQGVLADRVVDIAVTESGRLRLQAELRGRRWAEDREIGAPGVVAAAEDGRWLMSRRVHPAPPGGQRWVRAAIETAVRIAPLPVPPGEHWDPPPAGAVRRARASAEDAARLVRGGVRLGELRAVRAAIRELPRSEVSHGDLRASNVVVVEEERPVVLEWSGVRAGPRHRDLLTLWATTPGSDERARIAETVLDRTAGWEVPDVGLLWHAVALDQFAVRITHADRGDGLDLAFARERLAEARRIAADLGSPVDSRS
jgi:hypothetical protein